MTETTDDNVIKLVFNAEKREEDKVDLTAISILEDTIQSYMKDPPSSDFQLGYLFCAVDLLNDLGGPDYGELAHYYMKRMRE
jgi:hypothetical protein